MVIDLAYFEGGELLFFLFLDFELEESLVNETVNFRVLEKVLYLINCRK
jgi:hypothetical protein